MKIIVTGASGFVGKAVCAEFTSRGHEVTAIIRNDPEDIEAAHFVCCDMDDYEKLSEKIAGRGFDLIYHFAWQGIIGQNRSNYDMQLKNVRASCVLAEQCTSLGCRRLVYAGSIMEYEVMALMESGRIPAPSTIYSSSKLAADYLMRITAAKNGIEYVRAIISNIYGPKEVNQRLINYSLRRMIAGERCIFSAGEQMYDFIYIDDAAKALAEIGEKGSGSRTYYIGSRNPRKLREFLCEMRDAVDPSLEIGLGEVPFTGISLDYGDFDIDAVYNDTGFEPEVSFTEGIRRTARWLKENDSGSV